MVLATASGDSLANTSSFLPIISLAAPSTALTWAIVSALAAVKSKRSLSGATSEPRWSASASRPLRRAKLSTWVPVWLFMTHFLRWPSSCCATASPTDSLPSRRPR